MMAGKRDQVMETMKGRVMERELDALSVQMMGLSLVPH